MIHTYHHSLCNPNRTCYLYFVKASSTSHIHYYTLNNYSYHKHCTHEDTSCINYQYVLTLDKTQADKLNHHYHHQIYDIIYSVLFQPVCRYLGHVSISHDDILNSVHCCNHPCGIDCTLQLYFHT
jgi:hypothetical protein